MGRARAARQRTYSRPPGRDRVLRICVAESAPTTLAAVVTQVAADTKLTAVGGRSATLADLPGLGRDILKGRVQGRVVVDVAGA